MPRPCAHDHDVSPEWCYLCRKYTTSEEHNRAWGGPGLRQTSPAMACRFLGEDTGQVRACPSCRGRVSLKLFRCHHPAHADPIALKDCYTCPDKQPAYQRPPGPARHLLYHIMPVTGNGTWQRNVAQLRQRLDLFNGRRIIGIVTDGRCDPPTAVRDCFQPSDRIEWVVMPNGPLGENITFPTMLGRLEGEPTGDVFFYGHAKGVTRPINDGVTVHRWANMMYESLLDYWPLVERILAEKPCAGSFKMFGANLTQLEPGNWHYSGTFFWCRLRDVFARPWRNVAPIWGGVEQWPGMMFRPIEGGVVFHQSAPGNNLYSLETMAKIQDRYSEWTKQHAKDRGCGSAPPLPPTTPAAGQPTATT